MSVNNETDEKIASLAKLKIDEEKLDEARSEFNKILDWMAQLDEVDTDGVEPLVSVNSQQLVCREDVVTDGNKKAEILANAPASEFGYFSVPKVVE